MSMMKDGEIHYSDNESDDEVLHYPPAQYGVLTYMMILSGETKTSPDQLIGPGLF